MNQKVKNSVIVGVIAVIAVVGGVKFAPEKVNGIEIGGDYSTSAIPNDLHVVDTFLLPQQATADFDRIRAYNQYCLSSGNGYISNVTEYQAFVEMIMADPERKQGLKALMDLTNVSLDTIRTWYEEFKLSRDAMLAHKQEFRDHFIAILDEVMPPES